MARVVVRTDKHNDPNSPSPPQSVTMGHDGNVEEACLDKPRHVKYWTRCLKTVLPSLYTSNDSNRMYLAYFILSACDLLDILFSMTRDDERTDYISWIYRCQHPAGGFRMWPGTDFDERANSQNAKWDPANMPATYFALASLLILGDDLKRVRRKDTLRWIKRMQRQDGSFGETLVDGKIEGGRDPRFGYCATGIRHILRGESLREAGSSLADVTEDIDADALVRCIARTQSYEGGIADSSYHEPHAGYTFCSLGCLAFLDRLNLSHAPSTRAAVAPEQPENLLRWLLQLQTDLTDPDGSVDSEFSTRGSDVTSASSKSEAKSLNPVTSAEDDLHQSPDKSTMWSGDIEMSPPAGSTERLPDAAQAPTVAGFSGRLNKIADTCYAFWVGASLYLMRQPNLFAKPLLRNYLLELTQHQILGGFSKFPGDKYADLYHSYLGLAALSLASTDEEREVDGIKAVDAGMCVSVDVRERLENVWDGFEEA